ncbi:tRNA lysidine(34) synthetase TilS [Lichenibacterium ramalinae]|uniref:tRNA(Ile)-lysidine synthase n=1 Tax=Lichenibacterium ramalinae TaxID=2316527 RepID=A0A4Q2RKP0_9HYPH|nr:tRNA lysidine(34) synthetase TilS [Lichenibacterium ramalinae]
MTASAAERDGPLGLDEARRLLAPSAAPSSVLLAVSGGPDSIALMGLMAALAADVPGGPALAVATVDHGLRPTARAEAEAVLAAAARLGLPGHLLAWDGPKPATRLQERARHHRYALLGACARDIGATHLVTAHTRDDQAETVLFRLMRGSGPAGLAGMAPRTVRDGIVHLRPLLDVPKARLVATCRVRGWAFVEDPANADPRFARARLRALMPGLAAEGLDAARFAVLARRMAEAEAALAAQAERSLSEAARGPGRFDGGRLLAEPPAVRQRALDLVLTRLGAAPGRPRLERVERLAEALSCAARAGTPLRRTLHGAVVALDGRGLLTLAPAPPRRPGGTAPERHP